MFTCFPKGSIGLLEATVELDENWLTLEIDSLATIFASSARFLYVAVMMKGLDIRLEIFHQNQYSLQIQSPILIDAYK